MELGAILLILSLALLVAFFVAQPFLERRSIKSVSPEDQQRSSLLAERDRLIGALQELDFDHTLGKIPAEDYPVMRAELLQHAAEVLRKLDEINPASAQSAAEDRVEAAVAARRADAAIQAKPSAASVASVAGQADDPIEELLAARRAARKEKTAGFCSKCGKPLMKSDKFCPSCGKPA